MLGFIPNVGIPEMLILGVVLLLVFGPKRLPEVGRSVGRGLREFKESVSGLAVEPIEVESEERER